MLEIDRVSPLGSEDLVHVMELYCQLQVRAPAGHLAHRNRQEFETLLGSEDGVAVGAWAGGHLVAYSLCRAAAVVPYDVPFGCLIDVRGGSLFVGMGSVVHPDYAGAMLMVRLLAERRRVLEARGARHMMGLAAIDNLASLASILRSGGLLVAFARDETAMNYVGYAGILRVQAEALPCVIACDDLAGQAQLFAEGLVITEMKRSPGGRRSFLFRPMCDREREKAS